MDLLGHMGRYRVELDLATSPELQRFYAFNWLPIGNLGVDLLVYPLAKLIGLEPALNMIVTGDTVSDSTVIKWALRREKKPPQT